jgi:hypothetical protein
MLFSVSLIVDRQVTDVSNLFENRFVTSLTFLFIRLVVYEQYVGHFVKQWDMCH